MQSSMKKEQVTELYSRAPSGTAGQIAVTFLLVYLLYRDVTVSVLMAWAAMMWLTLFIRIVVITIFNQKKNNKDHDIDVKKWVLFYQFNVLLLSIGWGSVTYLFAEQITLIDLQIVMAGIILTIAGIGVTCLGSIFRVYVSYSMPMILMIIYHFSITDGAFHLELIAFACIALVLLLVAALQYNQKTLDLIQKTRDFQCC